MRLGLGLWALVLVLCTWYCCSLNFVLGTLFLSFVLHVLLSLPTFFLCWIWYWARVQRYYADHTSFQAARFRSTVSGGGVFALWFGNALLFLLSLGLGWSWIIVRNMRYYTSCLSMVGALELELRLF